MRALLRCMTSRTEPGFSVTLPYIESLLHPTLPGIWGPRRQWNIPFTDYPGGFSLPFQLRKVAAHQVLIALGYRASFHMLPGLLRVLSQDFVIRAEPARGDSLARAHPHLRGNSRAVARYENSLPFGEQSAGGVSLADPRLVARAAAARAAAGAKTPAALSTWPTWPHTLSRAFTIAVLATLTLSRSGAPTVLLVFAGGLAPWGLNQGNPADDRASAAQAGPRPLKGLQGFHSLLKRR